MPPRALAPARAKDRRRRGRHKFGNTRRGQERYRAVFASAYYRGALGSPASSTSIFPKAFRLLENVKRWCKELRDTTRPSQNIVVTLVGNQVRFYDTLRAVETDEKPWPFCERHVFGLYRKVGPGCLGRRYGLATHLDGNLSTVTNKRNMQAAQANVVPSQVVGASVRITPDDGRQGDSKKSCCGA